MLTKIFDDCKTYGKAFGSIRVALITQHLDMKNIDIFSVLDKADNLDFVELVDNIRHKVALTERFFNHLATKSDEE